MLPFSLRDDVGLSKNNKLMNGLASSITISWRYAINKKTALFLITALLSLLCACSKDQYRNQPLTNELIRSGTPIVDIRSEPEWRETGVVAGSVLLTFYEPDRSYDLEGFLEELGRHVGPEEEFAILCRRGNRSARVSTMLASRGFRAVVNLSGGILIARENGVPLVSYTERE